MWRAGLPLRVADMHPWPLCTARLVCLVPGLPYVAEWVAVLPPYWVLDCTLALYVYSGL